jgi:hypothetical protein
MRAGGVRKRRLIGGLVAAIILAAGVVAIVVANRDSAPAELFQVRALPAPTDPDDELLEWSELVLAGRCMADHGYEFIVDWNVDHTAPDFARLPYGTGDVALAERYGYGVGPGQRGDLRASGKRDPNRDYVSSLSKREQRAYSDTFFGDGVEVVSVTSDDGSQTSTGRTGCLAGARSTLYGDLDRWVALDVWAGNLDQEIIPKVMADSRYQEALGAWRSCMSAKGYPATDPNANRAVIADLYRTRDYAAAWPVEQATAVADARCVQESRLTTVADEQHREYTRQLFAGRAADVDDYRARREGALRQARGLLSELQDD